METFFASAIMREHIFSRVLFRSGRHPAKTVWLKLMC
jgi:hypothetical protein